MTLTIAGIIAFVTLLLTGLGWVGALRAGIRTVFGLAATTGNAVTTTGATSPSSPCSVRSSRSRRSSRARWAASRAPSRTGPACPGALARRGCRPLDGRPLRHSHHGRAAALLSGAPLPWRNVRQGALLGGAAITVLKLFGGFLIGQRHRQPPARRRRDPGRPALLAQPHVTCRPARELVGGRRPRPRHPVRRHRAPPRCARSPSSRHCLRPPTPPCCRMAPPLPAPSPLAHAPGPYVMTGHGRRRVRRYAPRAPSTG